MSENQTAAIATAVLLAMDAKLPIVMSMDLSERVVLADGSKENKKVGEASAFYPTLESFGIQAEHDLDAEKARKPSEKLPLYKDERFQWLYDSVVARVQAQVRAKYLKGKLRDNASVPETFADLCEKGERGGEWLKIKAEAKTSFTAFLASAGKSVQVQTALVSLMASPESILTCDQKFITPLMSYLEKWIASLKEEEASRFAKVVGKVQESYEARTGELDLS